MVKLALKRRSMLPAARESSISCATLSSASSARLAAG